jgi:hypothetical protein
MSKLEQLKDRLSDTLAEQAWFQTLKAKYEELDARSRLLLKVSLSASGLLLLLGLGIQSSLKVSGLKSEISEKNDLLQLLDASNAELKKLREEQSMSGRGSPQESIGPWGPYIEGVVLSAGLTKENYSLVNEKPGAKAEKSQETLLEVQLKKVNIKKASRVAFQLENGARPLKLRNLIIDTKSDPTGYLDATLHLSGFTLKKEEGEK